MGKSISNLIKRRGKIILKELKDELEPDFEKIKLKLRNDLKLNQSKKVINITAAYILRELKKEREEKEKKATKSQKK